MGIETWVPGRSASGVPWRRLLQYDRERMTAHNKLLERVLRGTSDSNVPFDALCNLLDHLGFQSRIRGSHHIFTRTGVEEILNLQPRGSQAKAYQVKQVRNVIVKYQLAGEPDEL
jgi:hypothetical protein